MSIDWPLYRFVQESNAIEGITREPTTTEIGEHKTFLAYPTLTVRHVEEFVEHVAHAELRDEPGLDVRVGNHIPERGGPNIRRKLERLVAQVSEAPSTWTPYQAHVRYETLHPFMDGNGRSGRVLWAWHMQKLGESPFALPFLHQFYYQALDGAR